MENLSRPEKKSKQCLIDSDIFVYLIKKKKKEGEYLLHTFQKAVKSAN